MTEAERKRSWRERYPERAAAAERASRITPRAAARWAARIIREVAEIERFDGYGWSGPMRSTTFPELAALGVPRRWDWPWPIGGPVRRPRVELYAGAYPHAGAEWLLARYAQLED